MCELMLVEAVCVGVCKYIRECFLVRTCKYVSESVTGYTTMCVKEREACVCMCVSVGERERENMQVCLRKYIHKCVRPYSCVCKCVRTHQ